MTEDELISRCSALPARFGDRLTEESRQGVVSMEYAGEYDELVSLLIADLAQTGAAVSAAERDELAALAEATGEGGEYITKLTVDA